jgi:hypothetical protein
MAPDAEQRFGCAFGVPDGTELLAFQAVESAVRREKPESAIVAYNNSSGPIMNFDDVGFGHGSSFAGMPALLSGYDLCVCYVEISDRHRSPQRRSDG